jgi:hypothetical protein
MLAHVPLVHQPNMNIRTPRLTSQGSISSLTYHAILTYIGIMHSIIHLCSRLPNNMIDVYCYIYYHMQYKNTYNTNHIYYCYYSTFVSAVCTMTSAFSNTLLVIYCSLFLLLVLHIHHLSILLLLANFYHLHYRLYQERELALLRQQAVNDCRVLILKIPMLLIIGSEIPCLSFKMRV